MRRDVCYFFEADVVTVYNAYIAAATNAQFRRECHEEPYHTFSFGLNFSMKYNMNGGSCTLHFIPYSNGTAVDLRFSIAQGLGARYGKYATELSDAVSSYINVPYYETNIPIETFLREENKVYAQSVTQPAQQPVYQPQYAQPVAQPVVQQQTTPEVQNFVPKFCANCGAKLMENAKFCVNCGWKI